jgi:hypothetical protein
MKDKAIYNHGLVAGLISGRGAFQCTFDHRQQNWRLKFSMSVTLDDERLIHYLQNFFDAGTLSYPSEKTPRASKQIVYNISKLEDLELLIKFTEKYPLIGEAKRKAAIFGLMVNRFRKGEHLSDEGKDAIRLLKEKLSGAPDKN